MPKTRRPGRSNGANGESLKSRFQSWYAGKRQVLWFGVKFAAMMALYYGLILVPIFDRLLYDYLCATARLSNSILNWLGQGTSVSEVTIRSAHYALAIQRGCDALEPSWFLCSAILVFPSPWIRKLPGILVGTSVILVLNLVRIVSLYLIRLHFPGFFDIAHLELWPMAFIFAAILLWIGWIGWIRRNGPLRPNEAA